MAKRTYLYIEMTHEQSESIASLCEMVDEHAGVTFCDWAEANPRKVAGVRHVYNAIAYAQADRAIHGREQKKTKGGE